MRKLVAFVFIFVSFYSGLKAQSMCGGSSATIIATSTLTNPSYTLNPGNYSPITNTNTNQQYFVVSPAVTTNYTLLASPTSSTIVTVTVNPQPNTVPSFTAATCTSSFNAVNLGLTFNPAAPQPVYTISWTPLPASVLSPQQSSATALTAGPYTVAITAAGGCSTTIYFTINPQPAPAAFTVTPFGNTHSITCTQPTVQLTASNANLTYTWSGASFTPVIGQAITLYSTSLGTISVVGQNTLSNCVNTYTFLLAQNIAVPSSTVNPTLVNITCSQTAPTTISLTASPSVNVTHYVYSPNNATFSASSYTAIYTVGEPGPYTYVVVNNVNGCTVTKTFSVTSNDNYPVYTLTSPLINGAGNFTLGCNSNSIITVNIVGAATTPTAGGAVSYTIIGPPTSTAIQTPTLSGISSYTINAPGTWTAMVEDNSNFCITSSVFSIIQSTLGPDIAAIIPQQVLDCTTPSVVLEGVSLADNISYGWAFVPPPGSPGNISGNLITVPINTASPTSTLINTYTLTVKNLGSTCTSTLAIPMYQNTFKPLVGISASGNSLTCVTPTILLTNQSKTGIPSAVPFPTVKNVIGYLWEGPTPQQPLQVSSTYTAGTCCIYTLTAKDLNNGCTAQGTYSIVDSRNYPTITYSTCSTCTVIDCGQNQLDLKLTSPLPLGSPYTYTWTAPTATSPIQVKGPGVLTIQFPGTYSTTVKNGDNGCIASSSIRVITGSLTAAFVADRDSGFAPLPVVFTNNSTSSNGNANVFSMWSFGNGTTTGSTTPSGSFVVAPVSVTVSPMATFTQPGIYRVAMFATKGACLATAYKNIKVEVPSAIEVPNVFTPNNDGTNDLFFLHAKNLTEINIIIYDRWGHSVYELNSTTGNIEWDGKNAQGKDSAEGVYFYTLKTTGSDGVSRDQKGTISLYR